MAQRSGNQKQVDWVCRVLFTLDIIIVVSGYWRYYQTRRQLVSPLIPKSTVYEIMEDFFPDYVTACFWAAALCLAGVWLFSFNKKIMAAIFFGLSIIAFKLLMM